ARKAASPWIPAIPGLAPPVFPQPQAFLNTAMAAVRAKSHLSVRLLLGQTTMTNTTALVNSLPKRHLLADLCEIPPGHNKLHHPETVVEAQVMARISGRSHRRGVGIGMLGSS